MERSQSVDDRDLVRATRAELERAETGDDETRLKTLDDLYRSLESELERDIDQAGPSRH